jgi:predicted Zn-dependent peptidase
VFVPAPAAPVATLFVVYRVGARNEAVGYTGSSHLLEHMLFKGTPANNRRVGRAFADVMNEIGAAKNATTWIDRTNYFETVPSGYLDLAIEMEADRMRNAFIADSDGRSERARTQRQQLGARPRASRHRNRLSRASLPSPDDRLAHRRRGRSDRASARTVRHVLSSE